MIIRTYQRRNRANLNDTLRDSSSQESFWSSSQESAWSSSQETTLLSSQELSNWPSLDINLEEDAPLQKMSLEPLPKKRKQEENMQRVDSALSDDQKGNRQPMLKEGVKPAVKELNSLQRKVGFSLSRRWGFSAPPNSTLLEAQESGEMMEQVDEVNFAMDGLRDGQPLQVQQASLLSMLSLCTSLQQRRFLRSHGIARTLIDAVVALPTNDPSLALAAASVLYLLAIDGHDANLMDTESCISFLLKLIGSESDTDSKRPDVSAKVNAVFDKLRVGNKNDIIEPDQLTPKSLAMRTLEKACLSTVVLDDKSGAVTKVGGHFKERLRESGGLDAICNVAAACLVNLMKRGSKTSEGNLGMLLRCLRVMENVTFLSEENQAYLLRLKHQNTQLDSNSFIGIVIKVVDTLQEIMNQGNSSKTLVDEQNVDGSSLKVSSSESTGRDNDSPRPQIKTSTFSKGRDVARKPSNHKELKLRNALQKAKILNSQRKVSLTSNCQRMVQDKVLDKDRRFKDPNDLFLRSSGTKMPEIENHYENGADVFSQDPYDFDEVDVDDKVQSGKTKSKQDLSCEVKSSISDGRSSAETSEASEKTSEKTSLPSNTLFGECLLSAVKVLMNLTNDNAAGCKQVAKCNGIQSVASLLVSNYPRNSQTEASLDLLVTVLGMLVNLVEKDSNNRSRLANLNIMLPSDILGEEHATIEEGRGMIALLCALFLSKKGSGEAAEAREVSSFEVGEEDIKRGQREAEDMIVEAYTALLLAFLSTESEGARQAIAARLPSEGLRALVPVLDRFVAFHLSLNMISAETHAAVTDVINSLRQPAPIAPSSSS